MSRATRKRFNASGAWLLLATLGLAGCGGATTATDADVHPEHFIPPHRPETFSAGVDAIRERMPRVVSRASNPADPEWRREADELRDIIGWLPELAADGDMRKRHWDQVNEVTRRLLAEYPRLDSPDPVRAEGLSRTLPPLVESLVLLKPFDGGQTADAGIQQEDRPPESAPSTGGSPP